MRMENLLTYLPIVIVIIGLIHYARIKMKKLGVMFVITYYTKWFVGVCITFFAFFVMFYSSNFFKENDLTVLLSLPIGILVWYIPMNYLSKIFLDLENKFKKQI